MIPLFKSHFSIGKSILTLDAPADNSGPKSVFSLAEAEGLDKVFLVEDSLTGFLQAQKISESMGVQLIFGLRLTMCDDAAKEIPKGGDSSSHKIIVFARTSAGCNLLNKIYSWAFTKGNGRVDSSVLKEVWNEEHLSLVIPFYDSFLFNNLFSFKTCVADLSFATPVFFLEDNNLPFDLLTQQKVQAYCSTEGHETMASKSIYYDKRSDFAAYQTYKCICSRGSFGRAVSLSKPNLDHCGSNEFCFESWQQKTRD